MKNGCSYKVFMLLILIILVSTFVRSSASASLWCEILSKALSPSDLIKLDNDKMFWRPASARSCNRLTQNKGSAVFAPPETKPRVTHKLVSSVGNSFL